MFHQNKKNNKNGFKSPSKVFLRSKSTENLVSPQKSVKRKNILDKVGRYQLSITKLNNLKKSKSTNSLKIKPNTFQKNIQTKSQNKRKNKKKKNIQTECKTLKKVQKPLKYYFSDESFNSQQKSKIQASQYFFYHNTYIPIENSAQRRFVYKIKEIDQQREKSTTDTFFKKKIEHTALQKDSFQQTFVSRQLIITNDNYVETQKAQTFQFGTSMTPRINKQISLQTQNTKFEENIKKCFSSTLQDLQFLFLPDENNFEGFSQIQRVHYKELFEAIAQKIWAKGQKIEQVDPQKIKFLLSQRQYIQMGMLQFYPQEGFPTHILAVNSYLTNLFQVVAVREKNQFLQKIQSIYGSTYQQRLSNLLKGVQKDKKSSSILSEQLFFYLENQLFGDHQFGSKILEQSVHIHNKAIFDAVNEQLQKYKPFYYSKGQPFPWSVNVGMTFFSIDQQSLGVLFKQIKEKVLMKFGCLCGILINYDNFKELPNKQKHPLHVKKIELNEMKMINEQQLEHKFDTDIQQVTVCLKAEFSTDILEYLIEQLIIESKKFGQ